MQYHFSHVSCIFEINGIPTVEGSKREWNIQSSCIFLICHIIQALPFFICSHNSPQLFFTCQTLQQLNSLRPVKRCQSFETLKKWIAKPLSLILQRFELFVVPKGARERKGLQKNLVWCKKNMEKPDLIGKIKRQFHCVREVSLRKKTHYEGKNIEKHGKVTETRSQREERNRNAYVRL